MTLKHDTGSGSSRELLPEVYVELRKLARSRLAEGPGQIWDRRGHFFAAAALALRRMLVERARRYHRRKRAAGAERVEFDEAMLGAGPDLLNLVEIDEVLTRFEQTDPGKARIVVLRYFAGLSLEETAAALGMSPATVKSEWVVARAWLFHALTPPGSEEGPERGG